MKALAETSQPAAVRTWPIRTNVDVLEDEQGICDIKKLGDRRAWTRRHAEGDQARELVSCTDVVAKNGIANLFGHGRIQPAQTEVYLIDATSHLKKEPDVLETAARRSGHVGVKIQIYGSVGGNSCPGEIDFRVRIAGSRQDLKVAEGESAKAAGKISDGYVLSPKSATNIRSGRTHNKNAQRNCKGKFPKHLSPPISFPTPATHVILRMATRPISRPLCITAPSRYHMHTVNTATIY